MENTQASVTESEKESSEATTPVKETLLRGAFMLFFILAFEIGRALLYLTLITQFFVKWFTGKPVERLLTFGQSLSEYLSDLVRFQTFNSEEKPFPFKSWPSSGSKEASASSEEPKPAQS